MKKLIIFFTAILFFALPGNGQQISNVGINTADPQAALDVNGDIIFRTANIAVADGITLSLDVNLNRFSYYRVEGPTADFTVAGISAGMDGRLVTLFNHSGFAMQLNNEDPGVITGEQILTGTGADLIINNRCIVNLLYDGTEQKWIVKSSSKPGGGFSGVWDTTGVNIFFNTTGNVGIGTNAPASKLTVQTELNSVGISHVGGADEIILSSSIGAGSASFGTTTNNIFSLTSNGTGKVHIWPAGQVVIGDDSGGSLAQGAVAAEPTSRFTIKTDINSTGWTHIGGADSIIVGEAIGGVSAALGTSTQHAFRLTAGTLGRVQIYPGGEVVVGSNATGAFGRFTVETLNNSYGISHLGEGGNILATRMGGTSAGIGTFSNTNMRLFVNGISAVFLAAGSNNVGIGIDFPSYKLEVNGNIRSKELIVETINWPDYVFDKGYKLPLLSDVEKFILLNNHLPNISSAAEIEAKGLFVGDTQKKMMEKIEELTLYIIQQQKEIDALKKAVAKND